MSFLFSTATSLSDGFNVGQQIQLSLTDGNGVVYNMGRVTMWEATQKSTELESKPINRNGYVDYKDMREGWTGSFTVDRTNGALDALEGAQEVNFHAGGSQMYFVINALITNDDNSVNEYQFERCAIKMTASGTWRLDDKVEQTMTFRAAERIVLQ